MEFVKTNVDGIINPSIFEILNKIDVSKYVKSKGRFSYLPWSDAWNIVKTNFPQARYENKWFFIKIDNSEFTTPYSIDHNGYAYVQTTVHIRGEKQTEVFPVLNHVNKSIQNPNSFEINTALKRALAKACANFGLGLYIYRGEDLPEKMDTLPISTVNQFPPKIQTRLDGTVPKKDEMTVEQNIKIDRLMRNNLISDIETTKIKTWMKSIPSESKADEKILVISELIKKRKNK